MKIAIQTHKGQTHQRHHKVDTPAKDAVSDNVLLIVDDEESMVQMLHKLFVPHYTVRSAHSGQEALEQIKQGLRPHVIIADQRMPQMSGAEFLRQSMQVVPKAVRIVLTGYTDINDIIESINHGHIYRFLTKPFNNADLLEAVRLSFEYYALSNQNTELTEANANLARANKEIYRQMQLLDDQARQIELTNTELQESKQEVERAYREIYRLNTLLSAENQHLQMQTLQAQVLAHEAELRMLRYQVNPHFLFNSLSSIRALVIEDTRRARLMLTKLSEYLRYAVYPSSTDLVPLASEIEALKHYFAIEHCRFEEQLQVEYDVSGEAEAFLVPNFIVQPLAENALKYGMHTSPMPLRITICAAVEQGALRLEVVNSGTLVPNHEPQKPDDFYVPRGNLGLKNIQDRLQVTYGERARLSLTAANGEVRAKIRIQPPSLSSL